MRPSQGRVQVSDKCRDKAALRKVNDIIILKKLIFEPVCVLRRRRSGVRRMTGSTS